ncbi:MAG: hypothetical protein WAR76_18855, partial [Xanthobacteraceae bacterium]
GKGFVPNVRQNLYSQIIVELAAQPQAAVSKDNDELPVAAGLPSSWDDIAPGHLVIAQEALEYGWWEAIVIARNGDIAHAAVSRLPEAAQVLAPSGGSRFDQRGGAVRLTGPCR